jgi:hypothetical protein
MFPVVEEHFVCGVKREHTFFDEGFEGFDEFLLCHLT